MQEIETKEEFDRIFNKCHDTIKELIAISEKILKDRDTEKQGPTPITIEEYRRRNKLVKKEETPKIPTPVIIRNRKRGGRQVRKRKEIAEAFRLLNLAVDINERLKLKDKIKMLRNNL